MSIIVSVAPNGGRFSKLDHPRLPLSIAELAQEARACSAAGARLMHFHVRGTRGEHSLDAGLYREALREIEPHAGGMILQISSESRGVGKNSSQKLGKNSSQNSSQKFGKSLAKSSDDVLYSPHQQARCIFASDCRAASVSFREICSEGFAFAQSFYAEAAARGIHLQHILYSASEAESFQRALSTGVVVSASGHRLCVLFVFGRDATCGASDSASFAAFIASCLQPFESLDNASLDKPLPLWFSCAFGKQEQARLLQASLLQPSRKRDDSSRVERGSRLSIESGVRLGFENNLYASQGEPEGEPEGDLDGELAETNAAQVLSFARTAEAHGITLATQEQTNAQLGLT